MKELEGTNQHMVVSGKANVVNGDSVGRIFPYFGHVEVVSDSRMINGEFWMGGFSRYYDEKGMLITESEFRPCVKVSWD